MTLLRIDTRDLVSAFSIAAITMFATGCNSAATPDAYGNFEATEVVVSAQTTGQLEQFGAVEGERITRGAEVALIDTVQLALQRDQLLAQRDAARARAAQASRQLDVLLVQRDVSRRAYDRTNRLRAEQAATAQQLDQAEREYKVLVAQIAAARAQQKSVTMDAAATDATVAQIAERIGKSRVINPTTGTVLTTYVRAGEVVQTGQPLYRIASLDTLVLRAYVSESQLASVRIGESVTVHLDGKDGSLMALPGTISWIASTSEFTPTPIQTRDERANLVYAMKVLVQNRDGVLKIGMPADLTLSATQRANPASPQRSSSADSAPRS